MDIERVEGEVVIDNKETTSIEVLVARMEPKVLSYTLPMIKMNFTELLEVLNTALEKYKTHKVTEENLEESKKLDRNLSKLEAKIETFRKDIKKELSKPIADIETECKKLVASVEEVKVPVNAGVAVFTKKQKEEKSKFAQSVIDATIEKYGIRSEYAGSIVVLDSYCLVATTKKAIKEDVEQKVLDAKKVQDDYDELIKSVNTCIEMENQRIKTKLSIEDFSYMIKSHATLEVIMKEIRTRADKIVEAEKPKTPDPEPEPVVEEKETTSFTETVQLPNNEVEVPAVEKDIESFKKEEPQYFVKFSAKGSFEDLKLLQQFIKAHGIEYKLIDQHKIA